MRTRIGLAAILGVALTSLGGDLHAQSDAPRTPPVVGGKTSSPTTIEVTVSYGLMIPIAVDNKEAQAQALESARVALYAIASKECKLLMEVIAETCVLVRLNVHSNVQRHAPTQPNAHVNANAAYRITPK